ncbi:MULTISPECIES: FadR/GntR family transcriptional regulator [Labrys]|uniref:FadR/GntR family transcriptional regulator n=1 Tax=Labrys TaxID=204476 RepID=UPI00082A9104|nr:MULTISPECIES: FadR/GntR family transcriptional regulator [unclassified Labrys (in: a-proteobacteria)]MDZ5449936.1 FadR/GntR family transcriptional regulator [Labrys sp. ZIDIC5]OCC04218.1 GntR family transcriptional regulator [Labrys sp. WJW]
MFERDTAISTMSAQVARIIGTRITSGEFRPGDTLPIENELCQAYGVSRSTVREAVKNLAAKGLVEVSPKTGTRVLPFADWNLLDQDVLSWRLNAQFDERIIEDLYEMRNCFEPRACFLAARDGSADDLERIRMRFSDLVSMLGQPALAAGAETEFHLAIMTATHNGLFVTIGRAVKTALKVSFGLTQRSANGQAMDLQPYQAVVSAILARKADEASRAMSQLLEISRARMLEALRNAPRAVEKTAGQ